jgi:hypothetical protein
MIMANIPQLRGGGVSGLIIINDGVPYALDFVQLMI